MEMDREFIYNDTLSLLGDIKVTQGPLVVASTLKKRPRLAAFLVKFQGESLDSLESQITLLTENDK